MPHLLLEDTQAVARATFGAALEDRMGRWAPVGSLACTWMVVVVLADKQQQDTQLKVVP